MEEISGSRLHQNQPRSVIIMDNLDTYIPIEYLEEVASGFEITVDYLIDEFLIDGQLHVEVFTFPSRYLK